VLTITAAMLLLGGTATADRGGVPNGGREDRPDPQGPPASAPRETPPGQEQRGEDKPAAPGQEIRNAPTPRRPATGEDRGRRARPNAAPQRNASPAPRRVRAQGPPEDRGGGQDKTRICHHTSSDTNPFVLIEVANPSLDAHRRHGDIIPAPGSGECPAEQQQAQQQQQQDGDARAAGTPPAPGGPSAGIAPAAAPGTPGHPAPAALAETPGEVVPAAAPQVPASGVLGAFEETAPGATIPAAFTGDEPPGATTAGDDESGGSLPFTGLALLILVLLAAASLALAAAVRVATTRPARH
jgi:hypothetical protein